MIHILYYALVALCMMGQSMSILSSEAAVLSNDQSLSIPLASLEAMHIKVENKEHIQAILKKFCASCGTPSENQPSLECGHRLCATCSEKGQKCGICHIVPGDCAVCFQFSEDIVSLACWHVFCQNCLKGWKDKNSNATCPLCRGPLKFISCVKCKKSFNEDDKQTCDTTKCVYYLYKVWPVEVQHLWHHKCLIDHIRTTMRETNDKKCVYSCPEHPDCTFNVDHAFVEFQRVPTPRGENPLTKEEKESVLKAVLEGPSLWNVFRFPELEALARKLNLK